MYLSCHSCVYSCCRGSLRYLSELRNISSCCPQILKTSKKYLNMDLILPLSPDGM